MMRKGVTLDGTQPHRQGEPTYSLPAHCGNCGWVGRVELTRGYRAPTGGLGAKGPDCPYCGCGVVATPRGDA